MICGGLNQDKVQSYYYKDSPIITVLTVVYNGENTIEQTIQSVLNQTYRNIEYIIIDGNSSDKTLEIIEKYNDRISYWQSEPDKGIYDAMNKGIDIATGEWICFMNSGDSFYDNNVISTIFDKQSNDCDVIYGNTHQFFEFGDCIYIPEKPTKTSKHLPFNHQSCFTKTCLYKLKHYDLRYKICADFNFYYVLLQEDYKFEYRDIIIANYDGISGLSAKFSGLLYKECLEIRKEKFIRAKYYIYKLKLSIHRFIDLFLSKEQLKLKREKQFKRNRENAE